MKKALKIILFVIIATIFAFIVLNVIPVTATKAKTPVEWKAKDRYKPLVIPHGGAKEMYPENTMYAFDKTSKYDAFEIDLVLTKDGKLITHHDLHLGLMANRYDLLIKDLTYEDVLDTLHDENYPHVRNFNGTRKPINEPSYEDWSKLRIKNEGLIPVPIDAVFDKYPDKLYLLELKDGFEKGDEEGRAWAEKAVDELDRVIKEFNMQEKVLMASFDDKVVQMFNHKTMDRIATVSGSFDSAKLAVLSWFGLDSVFFSKNDALSLPFNQKMGTKTKYQMQSMPKFIQRILSYEQKDEDGETSYMYNMQRKSLLKDAHRKKMIVVYWTVNNAQDMRTLIEWGADGIITDDPELLTRVISEYENNN